jgi:hypothetical protein
MTTALRDSCRIGSITGLHNKKVEGMSPFPGYLYLHLASILFHNILWRICAMQDLNIETRSHDYATVDEAVFSPSRAVTSRASRRIASPCLLPGNSYKHLDDARVGKGHVNASAVTHQLKRFPACQIKGI